METHHLNVLLKKYRENRCPPDEMAELTDWYDRFDGEADKIAPCQLFAGYDRNDYRRAF